MKLEIIGYRRILLESGIILIPLDIFGYEYEPALTSFLLI